MGQTGDAAIGMGAAYFEARSEHHRTSRHEAPVFLSTRTCVSQHFLESGGAGSVAPLPWSSTDDYNATLTGQRSPPSEQKISEARNFQRSGVTP